MKRIQRLCAITVCCGMTFAAVPAGAQAPDGAGPSASSTPSPETTDEVRLLIRQGEALYEHDQLAEARAVLLRAWAIQQSYDIATTLGQVEYDLEHFAEAARYLDYALRHFAPSESKEALAEARKVFALAKERVAAVRVRVNVDGAEVLVDGQSTGRSPLESAAYVMPGSHVVEAKFGGTSDSVPITAAAGQNLLVDLDLRSPAGTGGAGAARKTASGRTIALVTGLAITGVALGSTAYFAVRAKGANDDAQSLLSRATEEHGANPCAVPSAICSDIADKLDTRNSANNAANWSLGIAAVAAVATGIVFFAWPTENERVRTLRLVPGAAPGAAGFLLDGRFW